MSDDDRDDAVRRLLAEARHDEPLPPHVAARLDTLLGELASSRSTDTRVHSLAHRRRHRVGLLLAAAAAAVVVGIAVPQLGDPSGDDTTASDGAASSGPSAESAPRAESSRPTQDDDGAAAQAAPDAAPDAGSDAGPDAGPDAGAGDVVVLGRDTLERDVALAAGVSLSSRAYESGLSLAGLDCPPGAYGAGRLLPAVYDRTPAVLALRPPAGGVRLAEVLACGTAEVLRSVTVPAG